MKQIFINRFIQNDRIIRGAVVLDKTIIEDFTIVFNRAQINKIMELVKINPPDGIYTFTRFCQFVIYLQYKPKLGFSLEVSDYKNDIDAALDNYSVLRQKGWLQSDTDKIMSIFQEIKNNKEMAEMIIKDPF